MTCDARPGWAVLSEDFGQLLMVSLEPQVEHGSTPCPRRPAFRIFRRQLDDSRRSAVPDRFFWHFRGPPTGLPTECRSVLVEQLWRLQLESRGGLVAVLVDQPGTGRGAVDEDSGRSRGGSEVWNLL